MLTDDLLTPTNVQLVFLGADSFSEKSWEWLRSRRDAHIDSAGEQVFSFGRWRFIGSTSSLPRSTDE